MLKIDQKSHEQFQKLMNIKTESGVTEAELWERVYAYIPRLSHIPGLLFVGVGNSLSMNACHKNSDIDLFIITRKNRLWTVRILTTLYFSLLGVRKNKKHHAGKFCLSFFVTENALDFSDIAIENDIYLYFRILYMKPIIDRESTYEKFLKENQKWCSFDEYKNILESNKTLLRHSYKATNHGKGTLSILLIPASAGMTMLGDMGEFFFKSLFLPRTKKSFQNLGKPFGVIISENMLKFHDTDKRAEIRDTLY